MNNTHFLAALHRLRAEPLWQLLGALKAPAVATMLRALFVEGEKVLTGSVLHERLTRELELLRSAGEDLPQSAPAYVSDWLRQGWLTRRLPTGANEEVYELSAAAAAAIDFLQSALKPRNAATESRLATVISQVVRLSEETDLDPESRIAGLQLERDRIDQQINALRSGVVKTLPDERALERAREVIGLAQALAGDFHRVRDQFDQLNRGLRQSLLENDGSRGDVLESLFAGVDLISESDEGKTFNAFWRLLTDPVQSATLYSALEAVVTRPFARKLSARERRFLLNLTSTLMDEGSNVHDVLQHFARSLKAFVQSREFREQRRLHSLLKQAAQAALVAKEVVRPNLPLDFTFTLSSSHIRSSSQWQLYDHALRVTDASMPSEPVSELSLAFVAELLRQSEIDFRTLRGNIRVMLQQQRQISISELLMNFPAEQGLGSVVGYLALGAKHGELTTDREKVRWQGADAQPRQALIPAIYFIKERYVEFVD